MISVNKLYLSLYQFVNGSLSGFFYGVVLSVTKDDVAGAATLATSMLQVARMLVWAEMG